MPAFTCPDCDSGFIEEISPELEEERRETSGADRSGGGGSAFEDLFDRHFGRQFLSRYMGTEVDMEVRLGV